MASEANVKTGWQPIETAPKDGTEIGVWLVFTPTQEDWRTGLGGFERFDVASWDAGCSNPGWEREQGWQTHWVGEPTHWMPLPEPPSKP